MEAIILWLPPPLVKILRGLEADFLNDIIAIVIAIFVISVVLPVVFTILLKIRYFQLNSYLNILKIFKKK